MANEVPLIERLEAMDREIDAWRKMTVQKLLQRLASLGLKDRARLAGEVPLRKSIKSSVKRKNLEVEAVSFSFARHGIFLERGVGRGRPVGSAQASKSAKPWLQPVLPDAIDQLADVLAEEYADIIAAEFRIIVPGILNAKISK